MAGLGTRRTDAHDRPASRARAPQEASKVSVGKWRPSTSAEDTNPAANNGGVGTSGGKQSGGRTREASFVQKIDNPLSPIKQGRGFWVQRCGWLHSGAFLLETFSVVKDVPFSDAWGIRNKWLVRPLGGRARAAPESLRAHAPPAPHAP